MIRNQLGLAFTPWQQASVVHKDPWKSTKGQSWEFTWIHSKESYGKIKETMTIQIWLQSTHTYYIKYEANCDNVHDVLNSMKNFQPEKKSTVIYCTYTWKNNAYLVFVLFYFLVLKQFKRFQNKFCSKSPYEKLIYLWETKWLICIITQKQTWRSRSCSRSFKVTQLWIGGL